MNYGNLRGRDCIYLHSLAIIKGAKPKRHIAGLWRAIRPALPDMRDSLLLTAGAIIVMVPYILAALAVMLCVFVFAGGR
jgi:hypothetical protein